MGYTYRLATRDLFMHHSSQGSTYYGFWNMSCGALGGLNIANIRCLAVFASEQHVVVSETVKNNCVRFHYN